MRRLRKIQLFSEGGIFAPSEPGNAIPQLPTYHGAGMPLPTVPEADEIVVEAAAAIVSCVWLLIVVMVVVSAIPPAPAPFTVMGLPTSRYEGAFWKYIGQEKFTTFDPAVMDAVQLNDEPNRIGPATGGFASGVVPPAVPVMRLGNVLLPPTAVAAAFTLEST